MRRVTSTGTTTSGVSLGPSCSSSGTGMHNCTWSRSPPAEGSRVGLLLLPFPLSLYAVCSAPVGVYSGVGVEVQGLGKTDQTTVACFLSLSDSVVNLQTATSTRSPGLCEGEGEGSFLKSKLHLRAETLAGRVYVGILRVLPLSSESLPKTEEQWERWQNPRQTSLALAISGWKALEGGSVATEGTFWAHGERKGRRTQDTQTCCY